jgi:signal transduction histidine kinase
LDPARLLDNDPPPPVVIEQVVADDRIIFGDGAPQAEAVPAVHHLPPGRGRVLEIRYTASSFRAPEKIQFKYRLEHSDSEWHVDNRNRRAALYTNLKPGAYRFQVFACSSQGVWNSAGDSFAFTLAPFFYQTETFYIACSVLLVALALGIQAFRLNVQRRLLRLEQEAALQRERARIARDMHDDLGANLTQIAILSEVTTRDWSHLDRAKSNVEKISATARKLVDNISELVWATNPGNDTLDNLAAYFREYAASYFEGTAIRCHLDFPPAVPPIPVSSEMRRALFLVLKEAIQNAVKHSAANQVDISLSYAPPELRLSLRDNGRGFNVESVSRFSNGLQNMRRRVEAVQGFLEIQSSQGAGTSLEVRVRLLDKS